MKILLLGRSGQVGWELARALAPLGEVVALDSRSTDHCGDLSRPADVAATVHALRPQVVVNAAAHTAVDKAESEPELARVLNATAVGALAQAATDVGAWMVHYSTDYVFAGDGTSPWREDDPVGPVNVYGRTKLEGEELLRQHCAQHLLFRVSWVYAARGGNFARTMLRLARERERLTVIEDQYGVPTSAELIADTTAHAIRAAWAKPELAGTYHLAPAGETTWHAYACHVIEQARAKGWGADFKVQAVDAVPTSGFPTPAKRPNNSRLDTTRLRERFGLHMPPWQDGVQRLLREMHP